MNNEQDPTWREMSPVGRNLLVTSTNTNPHIFSNFAVMDGTIDHKKLMDYTTKIFNKYYRFKSCIKNNKYFQEIPNFKVDETMIKEIKINENLNKMDDNSINKMCQYLLSLHKILLDPNKPKWRMQLLQFKNNKSVLIWLCHHCLVDGLSFMLMYNLFFGQKNNLTNNTKLKNDSIFTTIRKYNNRSIKKYYFFTLLIYFLYLKLISIVKWLYYTIKTCSKLFLFYFTATKKSIFHIDYAKQSKELMQNSYSTAIDDTLLDKKRKLLIANGKCVKHSFNTFLGAIMAESMIYFMKHIVKLDDTNIPKRIGVCIPVNIRPFYDNFKYETVMGNKVGAYVINLPLDPSMTFTDRINDIHKQVQYSKNIHEYNILYWMLRLQTLLPTKWGVWLHKFNAARVPIVYSGVRTYEKDLTEYKLLGKKRIFNCGVPSLTTGMSAIWTYGASPNDEFRIFVCLDNSVCGDKSARLLIESMQSVLKKMQCWRNINSKNRSNIF